jgi:hypothetical protein
MNNCEIVQGVYRRNQKRGDHLGGLGIETSIILKWVLEILCVRVWAGLK